MMGPFGKLNGSLSDLPDYDFSQINESVWFRSEFVSVWRGPDLELICVSPRDLESWQWTCIGWRTPDDADGAEKGWVWAASRDAAEKAAIAFYLQKDE